MFFVRTYLVVLALFCAVNTNAADQFKIIETINGHVRGIQKTTFLKAIPYFSFKGIPFAKPPIGDLRFKAPEPIESWQPAILDAFEHGATCVQPGVFMPSELPQNENCLSLNIYIPANVQPSEKLAVLFFIHGGGYAEGASNDHYHGPDFIVEKQTILVTTNYRLGVLGFLSLNTPEYSGNMGLKDQQLALKWISSNIDRFGGDNKRITIIGESAGSAAVHFHMLSTESRKYFHNAIAMSGVIGNYWAMSEHNDHLDIAHKIAGDLDEQKNSYEDLLAFLKSAPADKISEYSKILLPNAVAVIQFTPVVERRDAIQPFLVESPEKVYETQNFDFDVLFTTTSVEFAGIISAVPPLKDINNDFNLQLPFRGLQLAIGSDNYRNLTAEIFKFYFGDNEQTERSLKQYITLLTHLNFQYEIDKVVQKHAIKSKSKTFYAWFSVDSKLNVKKPRDPSVADMHGASHADDLFYLFKSNSIQSLYDEVVSNQNDEHSKISLQAIDNITKIFTNFAKYGEISHKGDPISELKPVKNGDVHFLNIKNDGLEAGPRPNKEAFDFLASIEEKTRKLSDDLLKQKRDEL